MSTPEPQYNPNVPNPKDIFADSQGDFLTNFQELYNAFSQNHVALDALSSAGNHTIIQLLEQGGDSQTDAGEISVYTKKVTNQANQTSDQIFLRYQGNQTAFQFIPYQIYGLNQNSTQSQFFTFLPGGILFYFGTITCSFAAGTKPVPLKLTPAIAKYITTMNFCTKSTSSGSGSSPYVSLQTPMNGIYDTINLFNSALNSVPTTQTFYYVVLANI